MLLQANLWKIKEKLFCTIGERGDGKIFQQNKLI
jgi:hypothetical protein